MFNQINVWHEAGLGRGLVMEVGGGGLKEKEKRNGWFYPCDFLLQPNSFTFKYSYYSISTSTLSE